MRLKPVLFTVIAVGIIFGSILVVINYNTNKKLDVIEEQQNVSEVEQHISIEPGKLISEKTEQQEIPAEIDIEEHPLEDPESEEIQPILDPNNVRAPLAGAQKSQAHLLSLLKPTLPENLNAELIAKSTQIPGKPIIAIYRVREGDIPEEPEEKKPEPDIAPAVKPEPTIAIAPEPTVVPVPEPVLEPDNVSTPLVGVQNPQPVIEQTPVPAPEPVLEPPNVSTPLVGVQNPQPVIDPSPVLEPASVPESNNVRAPLAGARNQTSPHIEIISPTRGSFYTKKIQIEGRIANSSVDLESVSRIGKVTWEIEDKKAREELFFGSDGVFFLSFSAKEYSGSLNIIINAEIEDGDSSEYKLTLYDGNAQPELSLQSPAEGSTYGAAIRISGNVVDPSASALNLNGPASLEYSLFSVDNTSVSEQIEGVISVNQDGSFSTVIFSNDFSGEQLVTLTVHGRNGRTLESSVTIIESDSDIPGFSVIQEDGAVKLNWDSLPGVESYNLFYADIGIDPAGIDGSKFTDVKSPVLIRNFREGFLYRFLLEAIPFESDNSTGKTYWSDITETIILTPETLKPVATPGYQQINLVWLNIPGTEHFDILRRESSTGSYKIVEESFEGTSYTDKDVVFGKHYTYQIQPSLEGSSVSVGTAADSLPFPEEKTVVLGAYGSSNLQDIEVVGSYIFMADGSGGMRIVDNSDSSKPVEVGRFLSEDAKDIIIRGERAYVADGYRGIKILDINDPGNPILLGSRKTINASKLALLENIVFIADGEAGIKIIDISSERKPERIGSFKTTYARDLVINGSELIVADGPGGFKIIDISNPGNLKLISTFTCNDAAAITVNNNIVYLVDRGFGVRIINISDSENPVEIGQISVTRISDILVSENYIFISDLQEGLLIYEVSDPLRPVLFDSVKFNGASALTLNDGVIYLTDEEGFKTVKSFTTGRSFVIAEYKTDGNAYDLTYIDHSLYLADHRNGVKIIDVSNPTDSDSFFVKDKINTSYAESVVGYGSNLLIADGEGGVALGEIIYSDDGSQQIELQKSIDLPGITKSLVVYNNTAFIAAREEGMHILNLETKKIDTVFTGGSVQEIAVTENLIFIADGAKGLKIYSNTDAPEFLSAVPLPNVVTVSVTENYVVAGGRDGLSVIDVSVPGEPLVVSSYHAGWIEDVYLKSGYIYGAAGYEGLIVLDMRTPEDLALVSSCEDVYAVGVEVEKDLAFVADVDGFKVVKILIPSWLR